MGEAVRTADQHDSMKRVIREMRMGIESRFRLSAIQVQQGEWGEGEGGRGGIWQVPQATVQSAVAARQAGKMQA